MPTFLAFALKPKAIAKSGHGIDCIDNLERGETWQVKY